MPLSLDRRGFLLTALAGAASLATTPIRVPRHGGGWRHHGYDLAQSRSAPGVGLDLGQARSLAIDWTFEAGSGITATPAVAAGRVIAPSWDGHVYAVEPATGRLIWSFDTGTRTYPPDRKLGIHASPAIAEGTVVVASDRLVAIDLSTGRPRWERTIGDPDGTLEYFWAAPLVHDGRIWVGTSAGSETQTRGQIVCVDLASGSVLWRSYTVAPDVAGGALIAPPSLDTATGILWAATGNPFHVRPGALRWSDSLLALDAGTGQFLAADQVHAHDTKNLDLNCPPMLVESGGRKLVVVGGKDGIRAWNRETLDRLWHVTLTPALSPGADEAKPTNGPEAGPTAFADGLVFFASNDDVGKSCVVAAIEAGTGEVRWQRTLPAFQFGPLSVAGGVVWIGLVDGKLRGLATTDGEIVAEVDCGQPIAGGPAVAGGRIFVGTGAGEFLPGNRLVALGPEKRVR